MNRRLVILGSGESGTGSAILAKQKGLEVFVSDLGAIPENFKKELNDHGISFEEGHHTEALILDAHEIIKSPGIPDKANIIQSALKKRFLLYQKLNLQQGTHRLKKYVSQEPTEKPQLLY